MIKMKVDGKILTQKTNHRLQGRCLECGRKTSAVCSEYAEEDDNPSNGEKIRAPWVYETKIGRA